MDALVVYLLKANAVLALFAAAYYGLLRRLTFFKLNRAFLLLALLFAAVYPALPMPGLLPAETLVPVALPTAWVLPAQPAMPAATAPPAAFAPDWPTLALLLYAGGVAVLLARLLVQLLALARLRRAARPATTAAGVPYRQLPAPGDPFSFGRTIYLRAEQHSATELAVVLAHEQAHVQQGHTLDVLLAHVGTALFWINPAAWLLRRALLDNLEYLADAATLRTGLDRRAYQYCLLQLSRGAAGPALALPFTFFTLKNRVAMMNTPLSSNGQLARYFLAGPLVVLAALGYSAAHARSAAPVLLPAHEASSSVAPFTVASATPAGSAAAQLAALAPAAAAGRALVVPAMPVAVRTYLAKAYPQAKLKDWWVMHHPSAANPTKYVAGLMQQQQKDFVFLRFDAAGQFLGEKHWDVVFSRPNGQFKLSPISSQPAASPSNIGQGLVSTPSPQLGERVPGGPTPLYYLDGQIITEAQFKALKPADIASIHILKGDQARQMAGDKGSDGILIVTTEANKGSSAVLEFNKRVQRVAPLQTGTGNTQLPTSLPADALYYLDGQPSTKQVTEQLDPKSLASMDVLNDPARIRRLPGLSDSPATSVILFTTKANVDAPAVRAFADQADLASSYTFRPVGVNVLVPSALAYITSHYPNARLNEVNEQKKKTNGAVKYQVQLINGKRPFYVYFTPQGEFAGE